MRNVVTRKPLPHRVPEHTARHSKTQFRKNPMPSPSTSAGHEPLKLRFLGACISCIAVRRAPPLKRAHGLDFHPVTPPLFGTIQRGIGATDM